jgi:hypothetical protein
MARALKDSFIQSFEESDTYAPGHEGEGKGGKERDKAANDAITEYDRAKTFYFGQQKKNSKTKAQEGTDCGHHHAGGRLCPLALRVCAPGLGQCQPQTGVGRKAQSAQGCIRPGLRAGLTDAGRSRQSLALPVS